MLPAWKGVVPVTFRRKLTETESTIAFVIGGGLTLFILGFFLSSAQSQIQGFDPARLNIMMIVGALLLVAGLAGWLFFARPWQYFDDWSVPAYTGHDEAHHGEHAEAHQDVAEMGIVPAEGHGEAPRAVRPKAAVQPTGESARDDLRTIEGIGPKIAATLKAVGIVTFADLASRQPGDVERIVRDAGVRMVGRANTWVEQAKLAAEGRWEDLENYKASLRSKR
jgi:predicted flap endonuclease-1-like 5' DNA nuclease